jgi:hypothetical protein
MKEALASQIMLSFIRRKEEEFRRLYKEAQQFSLPDGSRVTIYKRSALYE